MFFSFFCLPLFLGTFYKISQHIFFLCFQIGLVYNSLHLDMHGLSSLHSISKFFYTNRYTDKGPPTAVLMCFHNWISADGLICVVLLQVGVGVCLSGVSVFGYGLVGMRTSTCIQKFIRKKNYLSLFTVQHSVPTLFPKVRFITFTNFFFD